MNLDFAFFSSSAELYNGKFYVLGGGVDLIEVGGVPVTIPHLALLFRLSFQPSECGREYTVTGKLSKVGKEGQVPFNLNLFVPPNARHPNRTANAYGLVNLQGLPIPEPGEYQVELEVDGFLVGAASFHVDLTPTADGIIRSINR